MLILKKNLGCFNIKTDYGKIWTQLDHTQHISNK
jgi:hypothetical protein